MAGNSSCTATKKQKTAAADESPLGIEKVPFSFTRRLANLETSGRGLGLSRLIVYFITYVQHTIRSRLSPYRKKKHMPYCSFSVLFT